MENNQDIPIQDQNGIAGILNEVKMNISDKVVLITPEAIQVAAEKIYELARLSVINEMKSQNEPEELLTQDEAAQMLGRCKNTLWKWRKNGFLEGVQVGGVVKYKVSQIQEILNGTIKMNSGRGEQ